MASDFGGSRHMSDLLSGEIAATPTLARLREQLERPRSIEPEQISERGERWWPFALDVTMLIVAAAATRLASIVIEKPTGLVTWDVLFVALALIGFAARGFYAPRLRTHLLDDIRAVVSATA